MIKYLKYIHVLLWQKKTRLDNYIYKKEIHILLARECNLSYMLIENVFKFFDCSLLYMLYLSMRDREGKVEKEGRKKRKKGRGKEREGEWEKAGKREVSCTGDRKKLKWIYCVWQWLVII